MKGYRTVNVYLKLIHIDGIRWDEWSASCSGRFAPSRKRPASIE